jgi:hypothetical protein
MRAVDPIEIMGGALLMPCSFGHVPWRALPALLAAILLASPAAGQEEAPAPDPDPVPREEEAPAPDLTAVPREIAREPEYHSDTPLYGIYVFGPRASTVVWAVLDRSSEDATVPDLLYFDLNANGDLTEDGERFESEDGSFEIGAFRDPATGEQHTELELHWKEGKQGAWVFFKMRWRGQARVQGGYAVRPEPYTRFAASPGEAPVLWPGADPPLQFQPWVLPELGAGEDRQVKVFLGHRGHGPNTFCGFANTFLPEDVPVLASLRYTTREGQEREARYELQDRC